MDAAAADLITANDVHPNIKAKNLLYIFLKYTYSPPESASMLAISALLNAPHKVITPARPQHNNTRSADSNSADIGATFLYTPEPMTELTVKIKAENNPMDLTSFPCGF